MIEQETTNKNKCAVDVDPNVNGESVTQVEEYVEVEMRLLQEEDVEMKGENYRWRIYRNGVARNSESGIFTSF